MVTSASCTAGAAYLLFGGFPSLASIDGPIVVSALTLLVATIALHQCFSAAINRRKIEFVAMLTLGLIALALVAVGTAGRNTEADRAKTEKAASAKQAQARAIVDLSEARKQRDKIVASHEAAVAAAVAAVAKAREAVALACEGGNGNKCKGATQTLTVAQTSADTAREGASVKLALLDVGRTIATLEETVARLEPPAEVSQAKAFAAFLFTIGRVESAAKAEVILDSLIPYAKAIVIELAAIAFALTAFPPVRVAVLEPVRVVREDRKPAQALTATKPVAISWQQSAAIPAFTSAAIAATVAVPAMFADLSPAHANEPTRQEIAVDNGLAWSDGASHLIVTLADAGRALSVGEAADLMGVTVGEASRRKDELLAADKINAVREGRFVLMSLN